MLYTSDSLYGEAGRMADGDIQPNGLRTLIEARLDQLGKNLSWLAEAAGMHRGTLSNVLNRPGRVPELDTLDALSQALRVPLIQLVEACGFNVERPGYTPEERAAAILLAVPDLRLYLEKLMLLPLDRQKAVLTMIEAMLELDQ